MNAIRASVIVCFQPGIAKFEFLNGNGETHSVDEGGLGTSLGEVEVRSES